jgi:hypothetical protein
MAEQPRPKPTGGARFLVLHDRPLSSYGDSCRDRDVNLKGNGYQLINQYSKVALFVRPNIQLELEMLFGIGG